MRITPCFGALLLILAGCAHESLKPDRDPASKSTNKRNRPDVVVPVNPVAPPNAVVTANRLEVDRCRHSVPLGTVVTVKRDAESLCLAPRGFLHAYPDFRITNATDGIHFDYNLRLKMEELPLEKRAPALEGMKGCAVRIHDFWERYGIKFDLSVDAFDPAAPVAASDGPNQAVTLVDSACRSGENRICMNGRYPDAPSCEESCRSELTRSVCLEGCASARWNNLCLLMLHETGHHLGLADEYEDAVCADRPFISQDTAPWSVMDSQQYGWESIEFYPRHLKSILHDVCP